MVGGQQHVGAEQLVCLAFERLAHAIGEEADGGQGGNRDDQRGHQEVKLAGARIAAQHSIDEVQVSHHAGIMNVNRHKATRHGGHAIVPAGAAGIRM